MAMARVLAETDSMPAWWPFWNAGMPFEYAYFPLLPLVTAAVIKLTGLSTGAAFHIVTALAYALGPVSVFVLVRVLSLDSRRAFLAGLIYSLVSPAGLIIPEIAAEHHSFNVPRRLYCLTFLGESPHVVGLTLVPPALALLVLFARHRRPFIGVLAALCMGATVLTNSFAAVTLAFGVITLVASGAVPFRAAIVFRLGLICLGAYFLICPWLPPSMLASIAANPGREGDFAASHRSLSIALLLCGAIVIWRLAIWRRAAIFTRFSLLFCWWALGMTAMFYFFRWTPLPQSWRYQLELELGIALLIACIPSPLAAGRAWAWGLLIPLVATQAFAWNSYVRGFVHPAVLDTHVEYRLAKALERLYPGQRVMAAGSAALWLNTFTDVPQLSGGHNPTAPNWQQQIAVYTIYNGTRHGVPDGAAAVDWLKAFGTRAVTVSEPSGREMYKPYHNPAQFKGLLQEVWREGGDVIYDVPSRAPYLFHVVPQSALVSRPPEHGLDRAELRRYVDALDDPALPVPQVVWDSWSKATIRTAVAPGQAISAQINYVPGWRASLDGQPVPLERDGLGLMVIKPPPNREMVVRLEYVGTSEKTATRLASLLAGLLMFYWVGATTLRRSAVSSLQASAVSFTRTRKM